jgi:hypothetical protein
VKPAPGGRRSLLRRLRGACGAALIATFARITSPHKMQRPALRPIETSSALRPCLARQVRVPAVAVFVFIIVAAGLWVAPARADETPTPPVTTTVPDAPPPDPYQAPTRAPKSKAAPRRVAPVVRSAPTVPARSYTPPAAVTPRPPVVKASRTKPASKAKVVRKQRPRREAPVVAVSLAPLAEVIAAVGVPPAVDRESQSPYLWLAGVAFAVLAVAGMALVMLTQRFYRPRWD